MYIIIEFKYKKIYKKIIKKIYIKKLLLHLKFIKHFFIFF